MRRSLVSSRTRSSWQRAPICGLGRECGRPGFSPCCNRRSSMPASSRASGENGGVLILPAIQTRGLSPISLRRFQVETALGNPRPPKACVAWPVVNAHGGILATVEAGDSRGGRLSPPSAIPASTNSFGSGPSATSSPASAASPTTRTGCPEAAKPPWRRRRAASPKIIRASGGRQSRQIRSL